MMGPLTAQLKMKTKNKKNLPTSTLWTKLLNWFLPLCAILCLFSQMLTLTEISRSDVVVLLLLLWAFTSVAMAAMIVNRRSMKHARIAKHLEMLILASKGKFFSISFTLPNGQKKVINGKNFYYSLLSKGEPSRYKFVDRNRKDWAQLKSASDVRFICGKINTIVGY